MTAFQSDPVEGRPDIRMFDDFQNSPGRSGVDKSEVCHFGHPLPKNMDLKLEVRNSKSYSDLSFFPSLPLRWSLCYFNPVYF